MKTRRRTTRLWVEELEARVVLSTSPIVPSLFQAAAHATLATQSDNWSGYAVQTTFTGSPQVNSVSAVSGSWVVPAVTGTGAAYSSFWVGIDGYTSSTVEQIGTDSDISNGQPVYYAWYEMYPNYSINIPTASLKVGPGDAITASVVYNPAPKNSFTLTLTDLPKAGGQTETFTTTQASPIPITGTRQKVTPDRSSAEWVVEAPSSDSGVLNLANFGSATIANASATVNGTTGSISAFPNASISMINNSGQSLDTTSALNSAGSSFTVTYTAPAVPPPPPPHRHHQWWQNNATTPQDLDPSVTAVATTPTPAVLAQQNFVLNSFPLNNAALTPAEISMTTVPFAAIAPPLGAPVAQPAVPASTYVFGSTISALSARPVVIFTYTNDQPNVVPPVERMEVPQAPMLPPGPVSNTTPADSAVDWRLPSTSLFPREESAIRIDDEEPLATPLQALKPIAAVAGMLLFQGTFWDLAQQRELEKRKQQYQPWNAR